MEKAIFKVFQGFFVLVGLKNAPKNLSGMNERIE